MKLRTESSLLESVLRTGLIASTFGCAILASMAVATADHAPEPDPILTKNGCCCKPAYWNFTGAICQGACVEQTCPTGSGSATSVPATCAVLADKKCKRSWMHVTDFNYHCLSNPCEIEPGVPGTRCLTEVDETQGFWVAQCTTTSDLCPQGGGGANCP